MEQKKSEFNKVLNAWDILVIAFGAMIGWGKRWCTWCRTWICHRWYHDFLRRYDLRRADSSNATVWWRARVQLSCNGSNRFFHLYMDDRTWLCQRCLL